MLKQGAVVVMVNVMPIPNREMVFVLLHIFAISGSNWLYLFYIITLG